MSDHEKRQREFLKAFAQDITDSLDDKADTEVISIVVELKGSPAVGYRLFKRLINNKEISDSEKVQHMKYFHKICFERGLYLCTKDAVDIITGT